MLEIRNLSKIYRSKTGDEVRALDNVSISFPETGMVFILGKSGSGKSTLLNVMGGLDSYDGGEFIIKGKSSKDFAGSDFDAYRNTFIGFIFQEYNVLDDFTVGANIALALELQGKKATSEQINSILTQVDLLNYAKRKPNELSGGQKQRVAIARALVKDPQIIMADEPTGALDSNTGKQIFDTLKKLSREKLVLIVSHDRDFAERYADRIVELADGKIISDVTKHERESERLTDGIDKIGTKILRIKNGYRLTAADVQMINDYLSQTKGDVLLSGDDRVNDELRSAAGISERGTTAVFEGTDSQKDYTIKKYEKKESKFIRSRLPIKNALRIGSSGLKRKKFRLVMTVLLSLLAFALFGFADTMADYNKIVAATESIMDSNVKNASITVNVRHTHINSKGERSSYFQRTSMNEDDLEYLRQTTGLNFVPVFNGSDVYGHNVGFSIANNMQSYSTGSRVFTGKIHGLVAMDQSDISMAGFNVIGELPDEEGEIAITELMYQQFNEYGFRDADTDASIAAGNVTKDIGTQNSIIGKYITLSGNAGRYGETVRCKIVGIVDTQFDYDRYDAFMPKENTGMPQVEEEGNALTEMVLGMELESELNYGFHGLAFMTEEDIESASATLGSSMQGIGTHMSGWDKTSYIALIDPESDGDGKDSAFTFTQIAGSSALPKMKITWVDGVQRASLQPNEVLINSAIINQLSKQEAELDVADIINEEAMKLFGEAAWNASLSDEKGDKGVSYWDRLSSIAQEKNPPMEYDELQKACIPMIERIYQIDIPDSASMDTISRLFDVLYNTSADNTIYIVRKYELGNILANIYGLIDVEKGRLWENEAFISVMLKDQNMSDIEKQWENMTSDEEKKSFIAMYYCNTYLASYGNGYNDNPYGDHTGKELETMTAEVFAKVTGITLEDIVSALSFEFFERDMALDHVTSVKKYDYKIVGLFESDSLWDLIVNDTMLEDYNEWFINQMPKDMSYTEEVAEHEEGIWSFALAPIGQDHSVIERLVTMNYDETGDLKFNMHNPIIGTLDTFNEFIEIGSVIFLYVGIGFAVFSALLLMNFIATSISYKKREIGVLRAVGARSSDVFKIFFSEALIIAVINFILSTAVVVAAVIVTNTLMHNNGINVTLLSYGPRQFIIMLLISVGVALLSSFLPVYNIAKRKPVDAIKDR